jgi:hypothetical protein
LSAIEIPSLEDLEFLQYLICDCGYLGFKPLPGRRYAAVVPFNYTTSIVDGRMGDRAGYDRRWCYHTADQAERALDAWNGAPGTEPEGWHRALHDGRRRPAGDAAREYMHI